MQCYVYKGDRQPDYYLYLKQELTDVAVADGFPDAILELMGELSLVVEFDLLPDRQLPQADASKVLQDIAQQGFYLQMPKKDMRAVEEQYFN